MIPNVDDKVLTSEFGTKNVVPPKPEAPWIKRCDFGIKFTDEIQIIENPILSETEESINNTNNNNKVNQNYDDDYENEYDVDD